jgi:hypothetical protein
MGAVSGREGDGFRNRNTLPGSQKQSVERVANVREKARSDQALRMAILQRRTIDARIAFDE